MKSKLPYRFKIIGPFALIAIPAVLIAVSQSGCGSSSSSSSTEDSSTTGSAAAITGGAVNGSSSSGTLSLNLMNPHETLSQFYAWANPFTPAEASTACTAFNGTTENITYSDCSFSGSSAVWNGTVDYTVSGSSVLRVAQNGLTRTASTGTVVTINTSTGMTPYSGATTPGSGTTATLSGTTVTALAINGVNMVAASASGTTLYNHVLTTNSANGGTALTLSNGSWGGVIILYHQLARVTATITLNSVTFTSGCCLPTGGSMTTSFSISSTASEYSKYNGKSESLEFTGCGTATYTGPEGYSGSVTLSHCI